MCHIPGWKVKKKLNIIFFLDYPGQCVARNLGMLPGTLGACNARQA